MGDSDHPKIPRVQAIDQTSRSSPAVACSSSEPSWRSSNGGLWVDVLYVHWFCSLWKSRPNSQTPPRCQRARSSQVSRKESPYASSIGRLTGVTTILFRAEKLERDASISIGITNMFKIRISCLWHPNDSLRSTPTPEDRGNERRSSWGESWKLLATIRF